MSAARNAPYRKNQRQLQEVLTMSTPALITSSIASFLRSPLARWHEADPWAITLNAPDRVRELLEQLQQMDDYDIADNVAVHRTAVVEEGAVVKGPVIIGPGCFVAGTAYIRGGCWLDANCTIGPGAELKSSFMFAGSKLAHLNFVGDSILGSDVNLEAGSMVINFRNERQDHRIRVKLFDGLRDTGVDKFGALIGDHCRIGANAVIAPGALLAPDTILPRLTLLDQDR
jgi:UDP-N-acetylglucosamine diphosphorylase / glucose-1-phosphate thymidylyltransferase / UDP-N-acetylgalactosamine diphosphorylase / glucosamine-1-phosphate N-acetyltransferase / galactosamine-1-phosphate N-acetyltransferase